MHGSILSLWLILSCVTLAEPPADDAAEPTADLSEAKRLFDEGTVRYDAADFSGAIEVFTLALGELREQGVDEFRIRGLLLFNIGRAHMRAYEIDEELEHLRQARSIFQRFIVEAETYPDQVEPRDIAEAEVAIEEINTLLSMQDPPREPPPPTYEPDTDTNRAPPTLEHLRASGIGLTVTGVALLGAGVGMLVWGSGYGAAAEGQVAGLDALALPGDSTAYDDADAFIASERRKGAAWMGVGAVVATGGVVSLAFGIRQLVWAKRHEQLRARPTAAIGPQGAWIGAVGRF